MEKLSKPVWQIALEVMEREGETYLSRSNFGVLDTIGRLATHTRLPALHPLDRHIAVLNALEKSGRFTKSYVRLDRRSRLFRPTKSAWEEFRKSASAADTLRTGSGGEKGGK